MRSYEDIIATKARHAAASGFDADVCDPWLFPFQQHAVRWALAGGRRALFEDTGLGKSRQEIAFADRVERHAGGRVLVLAPLAVGPQTVREAVAVGVDGVTFARTPSEATSARIVVTNYDNLDKWDAEAFAGVVLDESSILKSFMGSTRRALTERFATTPFRLCATATPAPNDHDELGNHSEFLGIMPRTTMLASFFVNDSSDTGTWNLRGHAVRPFWDWVASWALSARRPSDVGPYDDTPYNLPELRLHRHIVAVDLTDDTGTALFRLPGLSATGVHKEKRRTLAARVARVAEVVAAEPDESWLLWCETDYEADALMGAIPGAIEVSGSMPADTKASRLLGFADNGGRLVTKPKIAGFGMNWQNCARMVFSGGSYSYEAFYQAVRRCWRFGQTREVHAHVVMAYTEQHMWDVVAGKADTHAAMQDEMFAASRRAHGSGRGLIDYHPHHIGRVPAWLTTKEDPEGPCSV